MTVPGTVTVDHVVLASIPGPGAEARYAPVDAGLAEVRSPIRLRVRFQVRNSSDVTIALTPQLDVRIEPAPGQPGAAFGVVPVLPVPGGAVHLDREWEAVPGQSGTRLGPVEQVIGIPALRLTDSAEGGTVVAGHHTLSENPDRSLVLPPSGVSEQEFTILMTEDATPSTGYQFRLSDAGNPVAGAGIATVRMGPGTPAAPSPGQRRGTDVGPAASVVRYALLAPAAPGPAKGATGAAAAGVVAAAAGGLSAVHGPYRLDADQCSSCHRAHAGQGSNLLVLAGPQSTLCFTCHDGTGAPQDVKTGYADPAVPANDPATGAYYTHDALTAGRHVSATTDEFGGVTNRHSACGDCHNSHRATDTPGQQTSAGWTPSGRLAGISGVAVTNGGAGAAPAYTFLNGTTNPITLEYQLCFKCHSGYTTLRTSAGLPPSRYALDKAVELNPANASFHPVEAPGTNRTANLAGSLAGTSPYKLWNFRTDSTIRCTNCHAGGPASAAGPLPADADLSPHVSTNRAILLRPYRDEVLKSSREPYAAADFALCYLCHAEAPFTGAATGTSNFRYHRKHVSGIGGEGSGGSDINTPGHGAGNALCAECHFRIHGSSSAYGTQNLSGTRLVNFAPDVTPNNGVISWTSNGTGGSCTLTCHGERHNGFRY